MNEKKALAALAAVKHYLILEKARKLEYSHSPSATWTHSGRQSMMANRNLMQRRAIKR